MKIGVFDSGIGGQSVVNAIKKKLPDYEVVFKNDSEHMPYGIRDLSEIYSLTKPILQSLIDDGCDVIVVACNTVTTNFRDQLRQELSVPLVGMEPMVKPAVLASKSKIIAVCATPRTLESERYKWLKQQYAQGVVVLEPDCSDWAYMIEVNSVNRSKVAKIVDDVCEAGADQIVLGCTHYHWIESLMRELAEGRAEIMQPETPVITQLKKVLDSLPKK